MAIFWYKTALEIGIMFSVYNRPYFGITIAIFFKTQLYFSKGRAMCHILHLAVQHVAWYNLHSNSGIIYTPPFFSPVQSTLVYVVCRLTL